MKRLYTKIFKMKEFMDHFNVSEENKDILEAILSDESNDETPIGDTDISVFCKKTEGAIVVLNVSDYKQIMIRKLLAVIFNFQTKEVIAYKVFEAKAYLDVHKFIEPYYTCSAAPIRCEALKTYTEDIFVLKDTKVLLKGTDEVLIDLANNKAKNRASEDVLKEVIGKNCIIKIDGADINWHSGNKDRQEYMWILRETMEKIINDHDLDANDVYDRLYQKGFIYKNETAKRDPYFVKSEDKIVKDMAKAERKRLVGINKKCFVEKEGQQKV